MQRFCGEMVHVRKKLLSGGMCRIVAMKETNYEDYCKRFPKSLHCIFFVLHGPRHGG